MKIKMPVGAKYVIEQLNKNGHEAYIVGGCVRDALLGEEPHDWDITTSAKPEEVKRIFDESNQKNGRSKTIDTGLQHGTVTVLISKRYMQELITNQPDAIENNQPGATENNQPDAITKPEAIEITMEDRAFEVTTYRVDGKYEDHRRPTEVTFTVSLEEDLKRRDFTINAMAYNDEKGLVDIFSGEEDLKKGVIRCVGNPTERFDEDALRILRAERFAAKLGFCIEENTRIAMKEQAKFLQDISAERIREELTKLIVSKHPEQLVDAYEVGLTKYFLPEFDVMMETEQNNPYHMYSVGMHTIKVMENVPDNVVLRYTALLHDIGKPQTKTTTEDGIDHFYGHQKKSADMAKDILQRLRFDNDTIAKVQLLVLNHDYGLDNAANNLKSFRRFLGKLGRENFDEYIDIRKGDMAGQSDYKLSEKQESLQQMVDMFAVVQEEKQCINMKELAIGGKDLIAMGLKPGPKMGEILNTLLEKVYDEPDLNDKETLLSMAREMM